MLGLENCNFLQYYFLLKSSQYYNPAKRMVMHVVPRDPPSSSESTCLPTSRPSRRAPASTFNSELSSPTKVDSNPNPSHRLRTPLYQLWARYLEGDNIMTKNWVGSRSEWPSWFFDKSGSGRATRPIPKFGPCRDALYRVFLNFPRPF